MAAASLNSVATCCCFISEYSRNTPIKIRGFITPIRTVRVRESPYSKTERRLFLSATKDDLVVTNSSSKGAENESVIDFEAGNEAANNNNNAYNEKIGPKRLPLTAKEKLKAARILNRYNESKELKPRPVGALGSRVLEALKEGDKGKMKSGLPEAPTDLFDDGKRGMPKAGLTFELPVGVDIVFIIFSFVFISTVMFATTYLVWKLGAIHFNE